MAAREADRLSVPLAAAFIGWRPTRGAEAAAVAVAAARAASKSAWAAEVWLAGAEARAHERWRRGQEEA